MMNLQVRSITDQEPSNGTSSWRSFGSIASALVARAEAEQARTAPTDEVPFRPVAWAAE